MAHISGKPDRVFMKILSHNLQTRKSPLKFGSHPDPESGSGLWIGTPHRICLGGGMQSLSALVIAWQTWQCIIFTAQNFMHIIEEVEIEFLNGSSTVRPNYLWKLF